jgi:transposase
VGPVLVELSVMEQRYQAVLAVVQDGWKVTEVAGRLGVSRQSVHAWISRYEQDGLGALADRSHRPDRCPHQTPAEIEAQICELRRQHPGWDPVASATSSPGWGWRRSRPDQRSTGACVVTS